MRKTETIDLKGKSYAQVKDRVKEFRSDCPRGKIETIPMVQEDGTIIFKAYILKDKADETSADATGHSFSGEIAKDTKKEKFFEKLETIAVGRALANLGYASDGEIASSEEMEEFEASKEEKQRAFMEAMSERIGNAKDLEELKLVWASFSAEERKALEQIKELKKKELSAKDKDNESN